ncbi:AraC family transcriptional regulator [Hephaestia mangrovi]|uniref:AraC family transcriptional regulator n=1 Tax=Hephaestia mangrovi TaxID=2873268 RepID=UPI001CA76D1B|nr:AraC family transcriptional regulator [Hephaestia mangrovi]MBY8829904.1 AraC family transcriptional regulator [Hephaestia mangrovi]
MTSGPAARFEINDRSRSSSAGVVQPPLLNQKIFAPYKIATLIETFESRGMAVEAILARTDLTVAQVSDPHTLTSIRQYITACDNIIAAGASSITGYAVGSRLHLSAYGMYGYALICSPTMREFFDFAVRYHQLATPTLRLGWRQEGNLAIWDFAELYGEIMSDDLRSFLVRQQMMMTSTHVRDVAGVEVRPTMALFSLSGTTEDEHILGCACRFEQSANELHYPAQILERAPQLANRLTRDMLQETCDRLVGQARMSSGVAGEVYQLLMLAPNRFPSMQAIANQLGMTERTLRRRLTAESSSYGAIIDDVRRKLALEYLQATRMSVDDVAWRVGFSDGANLRRAIRRWTGKTISEIRRQ